MVAGSPKALSPGLSKTDDTGQVWDMQVLMQVLQPTESSLLPSRTLFTAQYPRLFFPVPSCFAFVLGSYLVVLMGYLGSMPCDDQRTIQCQEVNPGLLHAKISPLSYLSNKQYRFTLDLISNHSVFISFKM